MSDYVDELIAALSHEQTLKRRGAFAGRAGLVPLPLESAEDPSVKMEATLALGKIGGSQAGAVLLQCLEMPQALPVRLAAGEGLARQL